MTTKQGHFAASGVKRGHRWAKIESN